MRDVIRYCLLLIPCVAAAQEGEPAPGFGRVRLFTPAPGAIVMAGDSTLGGADLVHTLPVGGHVLRLVEGDAGAWSPRVDSVEVEVAAGAWPTIVDLRLPIRYRIVTLPSGASVALERVGGAREPLGLTPLTIDRREPLVGTLVASRPGFADAGGSPADSSRNRVIVWVRRL